MVIALIVATFFSTCGLAATAWYGYRIGLDPQHFRTHFLLAVTSTFISVLSHSMTMFFFIGTGKWMKEQVSRLELSVEVLPTIYRTKKLYFGPATLTILVTMAATILGGGAHTGVVPGWVHGGVGLLAVLSNVAIFALALRFLGQNNILMQEVANQVDRLTPAPERQGGGQPQSN